MRLGAIRSFTFIKTSSIVLQKSGTASVLSSVGITDKRLISGKPLASFSCCKITKSTLPGRIAPAASSGEGEPEAVEAHVSAVS